MGAQVQLANAALAVEPGASLTTVITVRNNGSVVDRYNFEALGPAAQWVTFAPDSLSLFPEASGTVNVIIAPPRSPAVPAGSVPFGVRAISAEDPEGGSAEEGTLEVAPFSDVTLELLPRVIQGRRAGLARLAVDNRSNVTYDAELGGADPADALQFAFRPPVISVPPGAAEFVRVRIRPVRPFWRGHPTTKPFQLSLTSEEQPHRPRISADGSFVQGPLLPKWLTWLIAGLVALLALAVLLWFTLVKPAVRSTAKDAANQSLAAAGLPTNQSGTTGSTGSGGGSKSGTGSGGGGGGSTSATTSGSSSNVGPSSGSSTGLTVNGSSVAPGNSVRTIYVVPAGRTLQVTDMLIQNAAGDNGTLTISRNGTVLMQWSMADFRDLDYHWVSPTVFNGGDKMVMTVSGCSNACHPGVYYAGTQVTG
jgi:hypothetical protein